MRMLLRIKILGLLLAVCSLFATSSYAQDSIRIAVAANFLATMKSISKEFTKQTGIRVSLSNGATGMLYAQIRKGAPYDMFFAADVKRPQLLEQLGLIEAHSRFDYVVGKLVVWSTKPQIVPADLSKLDINKLRYLTIANPKTAPYGVAAQQVLEHYGLYQPLKQKRKIALGENIGKTYQYVASGNAQIGLIAKSYINRLGDKIKGQVVEVDNSLHAPLVQQAVVLKGKNRPAVEQFLIYFKSAEVQAKIASSGYGLPIKR